VTVGDVFLYTYYLDIILFLFLLANVMLTQKRLNFAAEIRARWPRALAGGIILFASFITYRIALKMAPVSYAVSVRQISSVFGVLGGILFFREPFGRIRMFGALLIAAGIAFIRLG
jgi:drug/metabolite transporter (DMT)-like permease